MVESAEEFVYKFNQWVINVHIMSHTDIAVDLSTLCDRLWGRRGTMKVNKNNILCMISERKPVERYRKAKYFKFMKATSSNIIAVKWKTETTKMNIFHFHFIFSFLESCVFLKIKGFIEKYLTRSNIVRIAGLLWV